MSITLKRDLITPMTSGSTTAEDERRVVDNVLKSKVETKASPLVRLSGVKTSVTYFAQITQLGSDYLTNLNSFNSIDQNLIQFKKIEELLLLFKNEMTPEVEADQINGVSVESSGSCQILPRTIQPRIGDMFAMKNFERINLYRVTNVNIATFENESGYEINFMMLEENFDLSSHKLKDCIAEEWNFEYRHVGTEFRTLFRREEMDYLKKMRKLYNELSIEYIEKFYDKILNSFFFEVDDNTTHDDVPYTIVGEDNNITSPDLKIGREWLRRKFYERETVEFIKKNNIFYNNRKIILPTQFFTSGKVYRETIYGAIEARDFKRLNYKYFIPVPVNMATPGMLPQLFGKVDLLWSPSLTNGCLNLLPVGFADKIKSLPNSARNSYDANLYSNISEIIIETIAVYINGKPEDDYNILSRLLHISDKFDELLDIPSEESFFIWPLLGYILIDVMVRFSDKNFLELTNQTEPMPS